MPFVKLDCGILNSTLWFEREQREVFLTALLMAEPFELSEPTPQIAIGSLELTGWVVPAGWYGFVPAASVGILHRAGVSKEHGMEALTRLGEPEDASRSADFEGRRLVRINGGFIVLNYMKYRDRDYTTVERSRRYRKRIASRRDVTASPRDITEAEAEAEVQAEEKDTDVRVSDERRQESVPGTYDVVALERRRPQPIQGRRRKDAAFEGPKVYVPQRCHSDFLGLRAGDESGLFVWYSRISEEFTTGARASENIDPDMFVFWRKRYAEEWPAPSTPNARVHKATGLPQHDFECPLCGHEWRGDGRICPSCKGFGKSA